MHVHPPKPLHGWRAFLGEVGIVVLGVIIALGAEQLVEGWHWNEKVKSAEEVMRLELAEDNGPQAYGRLIIARCLSGELTRIYDGAGQAPVTTLRQWARAYRPPYRTWDSEAWKTVLGSDVGSHMGSQRLIKWSSPYRIIIGMTEANRVERGLAVDLGETLPPSGDPTAADLQRLRLTVAQLQSLNSQMSRSSELLLARSRALGASVPEALQRDLLRQAQAIYGSCARIPDMNATPMAARLDGNLRQPDPQAN